MGVSSIRSTYVAASFLAAFTVTAVTLYTYHFNYDDVTRLVNILRFWDALSSRLPVVKVAGFDELNCTLHQDIISGLSKKQLEDLYFSLIEQQQVFCPNSRRVGSRADGGWNVCFSGPFDITKRQPCIAFSFGINYVYEYDDQLADRYNCRVHMFDPSMSNIGDHRRRKTSWFYRTGLSSSSASSDKGWQMRTLCDLFSELGYGDKEVDILKIDVEFWEWVSLEKALEEGCLTRVRQLMFETHTSGFFRRDSDYASFIRVLTGIFKLGFRTWKWHVNPGSKYNRFHGVKRPCCYELYLLNTHLIADL